MSKLHQLEVPLDAVFMKIDVKNYFMSGNHDVLVANASKSCRQKTRDVFQRLLELVLTAQWVTPHSTDSRTFRVQCGSGMGMACSGEVSDASLLQMAELPFILRDDIRRKFHIVAYFRFKEDILLIVGGSKLSRRELIGQLRRRSACFELEVDELSNEGVSMLDIWVYRRNPGDRFLSTTLYVKPYRPTLAVCWQDRPCILELCMHPGRLPRNFGFVDCATARRSEQSSCKVFDRNSY